MKVEEARAEYAALINPATNVPQWKTMGDIADVVGGGIRNTGTRQKSQWVLVNKANNE